MREKEKGIKKKKKNIKSKKKDKAIQESNKNRKQRTGVSQRFFLDLKNFTSQLSD